MRRDHKPYSMRLLVNFVRRFYTRWRLHPQFASVGGGLEIIGPHRLEIWGEDIHLGDNVHIQTSRGQISRLCTWPGAQARYLSAGGLNMHIVTEVNILTPNFQAMRADNF